MTCDVIRDLMPLCADGVASEESRAAVEAHIRTCEACRALYESMCAPVEATEVKEPDYMDAVRRQKKENRRFILLTYGVTLGVLLLLVVGWKVRDLLRIRAWYLWAICASAWNGLLPRPRNSAIPPAGRWAI